VAIGLRFRDPVWSSARERVRSVQNQRLTGAWSDERRIAPGLQEVISQMRLASLPAAIAGLLLAVMFAIAGQHPATAEPKSGTLGITLDLNEQSEVWGNFAGGLKTGASYNGLTTASLTMELQKLVGWSGAKVFASAFHIHGLGPSELLVGNQQLLSNIEATPGIKLYNLWLEQELLAGAINIRIGQEGANDEMMIAPSAAVFLNSSFGYPDLLAQTLPSGGPNYPLATPMVRARLKLSEEVTLVGAVFNGDPAGTGSGDPQVRDRFGTAFRLIDPPLSFIELWYERKEGSSQQSMPGIYKLGAFYHAGGFDDVSRDGKGLSLADPSSAGIARRHQGDFSIYAIADQMIWRSQAGKQQLFAFGLVMVGPDDRNRENLFAEAGLHMKAPFPGRDQDVAGIAIAYAKTSDSFLRLAEDTAVQTGVANGVRQSEIVIEATYLYQVMPKFFLQPDLQIVINPGASMEESLTRPSVDHSITIGMRAKIEFN
jgi:porin